MSAFKNTLRSGDQVFDIARQRRGIVSAQPRERSVMIAVIFDETTTPKPTYVGDLRFVVPGNGGKHEEDPPIEGTLPPRPETAQVPKPPRALKNFTEQGISYHEPRQQLIHPRDLMTPLMVLEEREGQIKKEMGALEERFKILRAESERNLKAIDVLKVV